MTSPDGLTEAHKEDIQSAYRRWLAGRGFRARKGQRQMIALVARQMASADSRICVVEAGTGTGKDTRLLPGRDPLGPRHGKARQSSPPATVALQEQVVLAGPARPKAPRRTRLHPMPWQRGAGATCARSACRSSLPLTRTGRWRCSPGPATRTWSCTAACGRSSTNASGTASSTVGTNRLPPPVWSAVTTRPPRLQQEPLRALPRVSVLPAPRAKTRRCQCGGGEPRPGARGPGPRRRRRAAGTRRDHLHPRRGSPHAGEDAAALRGAGKAACHRRLAGADVRRRRHHGAAFRSAAGSGGRRHAPHRRGGGRRAVARTRRTATGGGA